MRRWQEFDSELFSYVSFIALMLSKLIWKTCLQILLVCHVVLGPSLLFASEVPPHKILVLNSYHEGLNWTDGIMAGIREVFSQQSVSPELYVEYMDTRRNDSPTYISQVLEPFLVRKLTGRRYDLVLLSDNDALDFVRKHRGDLFADVPVVFCGINNFKPSMIEGMGAVTGVVEMPEIVKTIDLALNLHPATKEVIFIGNTGARTGRLNDELYRGVARQIDSRVKVTFWNDVPVEDLTVRLSRLSQGSLIFIGSPVKTLAGNPLSFVDSARKIREVSNVPLYSAWDIYFPEGIVGGKLISSRPQGRLAAQIAVRILNGENPESIELAATESNPYLFDYRELKRFTIPFKALPEGSVVVHGPFSSYRVSKKQLGMALIFMIGLTGALLMAMFGRTRAVRALRISEERFRSVIDSSPMGIYQYRLEEDNRLVLTGANPAADAILQVDNWRLIGQTIEEAFPRLEKTEVPDRYREVCRQGTSWHAEQLTYEGQNIQGVFEIYAFPTGPNMMACMFRNITERKRRQDQLRESKQMLQLVLDNIPQYVFWKDRNSVYLGCNRNFARAAGFENPRSLIGKSDYDLPWKKEESDFYLECDRRVMDSDTPELHISESQLQASGKQTWLDTNKIPLHDAEGRVVGILGTYEDITERKEQESILFKSEQMLREANRELEAFAYTVSHDLRTPLTVILGYAELLQNGLRDRVSEQEANCLSLIHNSGTRMVELLEDMLCLARAGQVEKPVEPVDTKRVVQEVVCDLADTIALAEASVEIADLPESWVPRTLLAQIFHNLISNALRYGCGPGDVVEVGGERKGEKLRLYVRDSGPGVPEEERERIFEVFYRGTTRKDEKGTGVGLATVQKIARLYEGQAWFEETLGGGSTFWLEMVDVSTNNSVS